MTYNGPPKIKASGFDSVMAVFAAFAIAAALFLIVTQLPAVSTDFDKWTKQRDAQRAAELERTKAEAEYWRRAAEKLKR